jgi:frataxin
MPHSEDPPAREAESQEEIPSQKTEITNEEYHVRADQFLESLLSKLEARQEDKGDIDVEYSVSRNSSGWDGRWA